MAGEEESEGNSCIAASVVKGDVLEGDGSVSSGGDEGVLSGGDGCAWGGEGSASVDDGDCGRSETTVLAVEFRKKRLSFFLIIDHIENPGRDIFPY